MSSSKTNLLIPGIAVFLVILLTAGYFMFGNILKGEVLPGSQACPTRNACTATPYITCTSPTSSLAVVTRVNTLDYNNASSWIAIDTDGDKILDRCYTKSFQTFGVSCIGTAIGYTPGTPQYTLTVYNSKLLVCINFGMNGNPTYDEAAASSCAMAQGALAAYSGKEKYDGNTNVYQCTKTALITRSGAQSSQQITYSSSSATPAGGISSGVAINLAGGDSITYPENIEWTATYIANTVCPTPAGNINAGSQTCNAANTILYTCNAGSLGSDASYTTTDCGAAQKVCVKSSSTQASCAYSAKCTGTVVGDLAVGDSVCINSNTQSLSCTPDMSGRPTPITDNCAAQNKICNANSKKCDWPNSCSFTGYGDLTKGNKACNGNTLLWCDQYDSGQPKPTTIPCAQDGKLCDANSKSCVFTSYCTFTGYGKVNGGDKLCSGDLLLSCNVGTDGQPHPLSTDCTAINQKCKNNECEPPYSASIAINGVGVNDGDTIQVLPAGDIRIVLTITETGTGIRRNVITSIIKNGATIDSATDNSFTNVQRTMVMKAPATPGFYDLKVYMYHPDGDLSKLYTIQVMPPSAISVTSDNPIQYDNKDIVVKLNTFVAGARSNVYNYEFQATFNNQPVNTVSTGNPTTGVYEGRYRLKATGSNTLRVRARIQQEPNGVWSGWSDYYEVTVGEAAITIIPHFMTDVQTGTYKFKFDTIDSTGAKIDCINTVSIQGGGSAGQVKTDDTGMYEFDATFTTSGVYYIKITSVNSQLGSTQLNNGAGQPVNILGSGGGGGGTTDNTLMYVIIAVIVAGTGLLLFKAFKKGKR